MEIDEELSLNQIELSGDPRKDSKIAVARTTRELVKNVMINVQLK